jgi:hypothetical protein
MDTVDNGYFPEDSVSIHCDTLMGEKTDYGYEMKYWIRTDKV